MEEQLRAAEAALQHAKSESAQMHDKLKNVSKFWNDIRIRKVYFQNHNCI